MEEETCEWDVYVVDEVRSWIEALDEADYDRMIDAINLLRAHGPALGRPLVDTIKGSTIPNLKELRQGSVRVLFAFDPWRSCILLVVGDKANRWNVWYEDSIPLAETRYSQYIEDRKAEEEK